MAPTGDERTALQARRNELMDALAPGDQNDIAQEIRLLKAGFPSFGLDGMSAQVQVAIYVEALEGFPVWAVKEARARFRDGRNTTPWKPSECPTSAQMAHECRSIISPTQDELIPLADVLDAEIAPEPDPDMQKRLSAVLQWEKEIRPAMKQPEANAKPKEDPRATLARIKSEGWGEIAVGEGLQAKFAEMQKAQAKKGQAA